MGRRGEIGEGRKGEWGREELTGTEKREFERGGEGRKRDHA